MQSREHAGACVVGSLIAGRYRVVSELGRGGAGCVYAVDDLVSGQPLALKRLTDDAKPRVEMLFAREYATLANLRHPNVVEVYDYGLHAGKPYYTMELLSGSDLSERAPVPYRVALRYVRDAAQALACLHARHMLHRDVSPRNLWQSDTGALKLLDFGALTPFGIPSDVVGTPPFVAPEALSGVALDQRTDLYALGGLLYWLLTGSHAYPARSLRDLPAAWANPPSPPSERVRQLARADLPPVPEAVDNVVLALLCHESSARPATAGEVIDRISSLTGDVQTAHRTESDDRALALPALAGRGRELRHFGRTLRLAWEGRGGGTILEGERGLGTSRLLAEFALTARLSGATTVLVDRGAAAAAGGTLPAIVQRLLEARTEAASRVFGPRPTVCATIRPSIHVRLGLPVTDAAHVPSRDHRARFHDEVIASIVDLSAEDPVVILIDDLESADDSAVAALAELCERASDHRILLLCALHTQLGEKRSASVRALSRVARRIVLRPLSELDTYALLRSLLSEVPNLARLVERIQHATSGNPLHITALLHELCRSRVIQHVRGTWVIPQELPHPPFARSRADALSSRLAHLSPAARRLGGAMSVGTGHYSISACHAVAEMEQQQVVLSLDELAREGVLQTIDDGYHFVDDSLRATLRAELDDEAAKRAHLRLGLHLYADENASFNIRIDAAVHMLEGGDTKLAPGAIVRLVHAQSGVDIDRLSPVVVRIERALALFREHGRSEHAQAVLLSALVECGYSGDRGLAERYGDQACVSLCKLTGIARAKRLRPYVGAALALAIGLSWAAFMTWRRRNDPCALPFKSLLVACVATCTAMSAVAAVCLDTHKLDLRADMLRPLAGFGSGSPLTLFADFVQSLRLAASDDFSTRKLAHRSLLRRLETPRVKRILQGDAHTRYYAGALYMLGVEACLHESKEALDIADQLDGIGRSLYALSAAQLRTLYYAHRGESGPYDAWRVRVERLGIRRGTAWQVETWMPGATVGAAARTHDAMAVKHATEQLELLEKRIPSLALQRTRAQGAYLLLRGRYHEALPLLEHCLVEEPGAVAGWMRAHGDYVSALNATGQHHRAREIAGSVIASMDARTRTTWPMTIVLMIEHARARAALGDYPGAVQELEVLVRETDESGAVTRGALQHALYEITERSGDSARADRHFDDMRRLYLSTGLPSLSAHVQEAVRRRAKLVAPLEPALLDSALQDTDASQLEQRLARVFGDGETRTSELSLRALRLLSEQTGSKHGGIWLALGTGVEFTGKLGVLHEHELASWVHGRLLRAADNDVTQTDVLEEMAPDLDHCTVDGRPFQLWVLTCTQGNCAQPIGAAVFERHYGAKNVSPTFLHVLGTRLQLELAANTTVGTTEA